MQKLIILICIMGFQISSATIFAQSIDETELSQNDESAVVEDVEGLRAEFKEGVQDPESKIVQYEMILKSNIDSDRVKITWVLRGNSEIIDEVQNPRGTVTKNIIVKRGQSYIIPIKLRPLGRGVTEITGKAEAFRVDGNYIATVRKNFASNTSSEVLPLSDEYKAAKTLSDIKNIVITFLVIASILGVGYFGYKRFRAWLAKP